MSGMLTINDVDICAEYGIKIGAVSPYAAVGNAEDLIQIPGRVGMLVRQKTVEIGGFPWPAWPDGLPNEIREYNVALYTHKNNSRANNAELQVKMTDIRQKLLLPTPQTGKRILTIADSYEPGIYREGVFAGDFEMIRRGTGNNFAAALRFSLDPRRFIAGNFDKVLAQESAQFSAQDVGDPWESRINTLSKPKIQIDGDGEALSLIFKTALGHEYGRIDFNEFAGLIELDTNDMTAVSQGGATYGNKPFINDVDGECCLLPTGCIVERTPSQAYIYVMPRWWVR